MGADALQALLVWGLCVGYFRFEAFLFKTPPAWPESMMLSLLIATGYFLGATGP